MTNNQAKPYWSDLKLHADRKAPKPNSLLAYLFCPAKLRAPFRAVRETSLVSFMLVDRFYGDPSQTQRQKLPIAELPIGY